MLAHLFPLQGQMFPLIGKDSNETCNTHYNAADYGYFQKNENYEEGWGDDNYVYRAFDISSFRHNEVYCLWTKNDDGTLTYGNPWTPRYMAKGDIFKRTAHVIHYDAQGNVTKAADVTTWIKLVEYHETRTFASGRIVESVVELQYGFTPDVRDVKEHYFYGKNLGLVGFEDGVLATYIGRGTPTTIKPQTVIGWVDRLRPAVPPVQKGTDVTPPIPAPTEGGVLSTLTTIPGVYVNVRPQPGSATDSGDLLKGDVVKVYPPVNGWVYVEPVNPVTRPEGRQPAAKGWVSLQYGAVAFTPVPPPQPAVKGRYLSPEAEARIRAHCKAIDDANAGIMAELDAAPEVAPPDPAIPF